MIHILRKQTMPQRLRSHQDFQSNFYEINRPNKARQKVCSQLMKKDENLQSLQDEIIDKSKNNIQTISYTIKHLRKRRSITVDEVDKIIQLNRFQINLQNGIDKERNIKINSFKKISKFLIPKIIFKKYQELNLEDGAYRNLIQELTNHQLKYRSKSKQSYNIIIKEQRKFLPSVHQKCKINIKNKENNIDKLKKKSTKFKERQQNIKQCKQSEVTNSNWKLKDFFDPIIQEEDQQNQMKMRRQQFQQIVKRSNNINQICNKFEKEHLAQEEVQTFAKYTNFMQDLLLKKQKKLKKLQEYRQY